MKIGATYSHREIGWLKLDPAASLATTLDLNFDILRLGVYWDESQPTKAKFDFSAIKTALDQCQARQQAVMVSVGMKAPRWPEYYLPNWLKVESVEETEQPVLAFIEKAVTELKDYDCIKIWQVENEPLDPSGLKQWAIPVELLAKEVALVRSLDKRPIHINLWGDNVVKSAKYDIAASLADTVGIDIYYHQPAEEGYHGPNFNWNQFMIWRLRKLFSLQHKPLYITELQAEPWEHNNDLKFGPNPGSINSEYVRKNFQQAKRLRPQAIFFWGLEYWLWRAQQGNPDLLDTVKDILK